MSDKELRQHLKDFHGYVQSQIGGRRSRQSLDTIHARSHEGWASYNAEKIVPHEHDS